VERIAATEPQTFSGLQPVQGVLKLVGFVVDKVSVRLPLALFMRCGVAFTAWVQRKFRTSSSGCFIQPTSWWRA
jgi:hypothetical protein